MATFNLTADTPSANLIFTIGEDDTVAVGRVAGLVPTYQAIGFETSDVLDLREFPELTAAQMLAAANNIAGGGGVRFETPFFTLTLGGVTVGQLSEGNFIFTNPPDAVADATTIAQGGSAVIAVLENDSDGDGDAFSITGVTSPANGTAVISGDTVIYNPADPTFSGVDSFIYSITDSTGETGTASVTVTVGGNLPPDAVMDTVEAIAAIPTTIDVLANDSDPDGDTLSIASVMNGANGTVSIVDSQVVYTPNEATFTGTDSFSYTINDGNGGTDWAQVNVTVRDNLNPIANPDRTTIAVGGTASIAVLENDSDPNGQALRVTGISMPLNGSAVLNGDRIIYIPGTTPAGDPFGGVDTFFYTIGDGNGGTASSAVTVTIGGPQPPVANDDTIGTPLGVPVSIDVLANDTDADGDTISISGIPSATENGTLSLSGNQVLYTPNAGFNGTESFTYTVSDGALTDTATVSVQVGGQLPPIASPDSATSQNGGAVIIPVLTNDSDPNGDAVSITGVGTPANGTATFVGEDVVYTPPADTNFVGTVTFPYSITDGNEGTATADITVTVDRERPPIANPDASTIEAGSTATVNVLVNDSDPDGDSITITGVSGPDNGETTFVGNQVIYIPNKAAQTPEGQEDFSGTDSFFYSITDGNGGTASASVRVTVGGNQPPDAVDDATGTAVGTAISIDVLANDTDPEGNPITIFQTGSGANGSTSISNNAIVYTPSSQTFIGEDSFVYTISDGNGGVDTATVTLQVGELPPVAVDDTAILTATSTQTQLINVLANDSDPDGGTFTLTDVGNGARGAAIINNNQIAYTPSADLAAQGGTDSFTYTITNDQGRTDTATVTVLANQPPVANNDTVTIQTLGTATIAVLDNDTDADGDTLQLVQSAIALENGGSVVFNNGNIIYTAGRVFGQPFLGVSNFTYSITDGNGGGDEATVTVNIGGMQPPVAVNETVTATAEGGAQSIDVLANDSDPDTDNGLLFLEQTIGQGANGAVVVNNNQAVYTPSSTTFVGTDSFSYTITDPQGGGQDSATATVIVQGNLSPVPEPDNATLPVGGSTTIDVLANDSDPNPGDSLTVIGATPTTDNGFTQLVENNQVLFTTTASDTTFEGTDTFTYTVRDGSGATATSTVTVSIGGNQPPEAVNDSATVTNVSSVVIDVLTNDSDPNGDSLEVVGAGGATNGTGLRLNSTQVLYTPTTSTTSTTASTDSFTYTVSDGRGGSDTATITVNINENGAPTAVADTTTIQAGGTATIDVVANDSDIDGDSLQLVPFGPNVNIEQLDNGGSLAIENGQVIYTTPNAGFVGSEVFTYSVTDGFASAPGTVTVIVGGNQPPVANNDAVTTIAGGTTSISVLLNDSDPDANTNLSITGVSTPTNGGSVIISNNGTPTNPIDDQIVYISPNPTFTGTDSFTYSISDQAGGVEEATVSVTVSGNQAPTANNDAFTVAIPSTSTLDVLEDDSDPNDGDTLRIIGAANASSLGSVTFTPDRVIYTPNSGLSTSFVGTDSFTYTIADAAGVTATATGVVTIGGIQPPDAVRDTVGTSTGVATTIDVLENDTDPANALTLSSFATTTGNGGTITRDTNGTSAQTDDDLIYTPNPTFTGTDTFTYTVSGGNTLTDSAVVTVVVSENQPPVANPDNVTIQLGTVSTLDVLDNDFDPNGEALSAIGAGGNNTSLGTVSVSNGQVIYDPNRGLQDPFEGSDSFVYTIRDSAATGTSTATVTVTLGGNQPPTAVNDTATAIQAVPTTIDVLANDTDPDADPNGGTLSITGVGTAANGTVVIDRNGTDNDPSDDVVVYTSTNPTFTGTDTFVYSVTDGDGTTGATVSATVNVAVDGSSDPIANDDTATVLAMGASTINVLANDSDPDGASDTISVVSAGGQSNTNAGTVNVINGQVIYTSNGAGTDFNETDSFTYTIRDLNGNTSTASVTVQVGGDQPPIANADSITITQGSTATLTTRLTGNDSDPDGDTFSIVGVSATTANNGTASVDATGSQVIYNAPSAATDTFTYSIGDEDGTSSATVTVTLNASDPPDAMNDTVTTQMGTAATIAVLANDSDPDGDALQLDGIDTAALVNGDAAISNNQIIYTPDASFSGLEIFTYSVTDGLGGMSEATVTVRVGGPQPPDAMDDNPTVIAGITNTISVLVNDTDPDADPDSDSLSITSVSTTTNGGTATINNNGTPTISSDDVVLYTPNSTATAGTTDSFTYTITDTQGNMDWATVNVTVGENQPPLAENDSFIIPENDPATLDVLKLEDPTADGADSDPNPGDAITITGVNNDEATLGTVTVAADGLSLTYDPDPITNPDGETDTFTYTIADLSGGTDTATVTVTIGGPQPPVANNDSVTFTQGTTQTLSTGLTGNDSDPNGDPLSIVDVSPTTSGGGTASVDGAGQVIYNVPTAAGTDTFTYSISDGNGGTDSATVTVSVIAGSTAPVANNDYAIAITDTPVTIPVLLSDSDPNGDTLSITGVTTGASISDDQIIYTGNTAGVTDTITYTITDGNGGTDSATVSIGVFNTNTARAITGDADRNVIVGSDDATRNENLSGGSGDDILIGRLAVDNLTGGAGADEFRFENENDSTGSGDAINGFDTTEDTIRLAFLSPGTGVNVEEAVPDTGIFTLTVPSSPSFSLNIFATDPNSQVSDIENRILFG